MKYEKDTLRIVLMALSRAALAKPLKRLKSFCSLLVDGWGVLSAEDARREYGDGFPQATLKDGAIVSFVKVLQPKG